MTTKNDNTLLIAGGAVLLYLYMKRQSALSAGRMPVPPYAPGQSVPMMPGSVGTGGTNQVKTGALLGFLQAVSGAIGPNSSTGYVQPQVQPQYNGAVQDTVYEIGGEFGSMMENYLF